MGLHFGVHVPVRSGDEGIALPQGGVDAAVATCPVRALAEQANASWHKQLHTIARRTVFWSRNSHDGRGQRNGEAITYRILAITISIVKLPCRRSGQYACPRQDISIRLPRRSSACFQRVLCTEHVSFHHLIGTKLLGRTVARSDDHQALCAVAANNTASPQFKYC